MSGCKKFSTLSVDSIVPGKSCNGMVSVGPKVAGNLRYANINWTQYPASATISAAALIGGGIGNAGAVPPGQGEDPHTLTMPSAATIIAGFRAAGINLAPGMMFSVLFDVFALVPYVVFASSSVTLDGNVDNFAIEACATVWFRVTSIIPGHEAIHFGIVASDRTLP